MLRPYILVALASVALTLLGRAGSDVVRVKTVSPAVFEQNNDTAQPSPVAICPPHTLPDRVACVPIEPFSAHGPAMVSSSQTHRVRNGSVETYEQIGRLAERSDDYSLYRYPVPDPEDGPLVISGYDLDRPDDQQRRGPHLRATGHGAVDLSAPRNTPVALVALENQENEAEVLFVGQLFGTTVITSHTVREPDRLRSYLVLFGHLEKGAPELAVGQKVKEGTIVGFVGDSGSAGVVHLHLEIRRMRDNVDPSIPAPRLIHNDYSIPVDPRNLLPLR